jgi:aminoglycoside 6'-N-acetyltransferase I
MGMTSCCAVMGGALRRVKRFDMVTVRFLEPSEWDEWARLRAALWPDCLAEQHEREMTEIIQDPEWEAVLVSAGPEGRLLGFLEVSLRPVAWGCTSSPVGYLEGWYVEPVARRQGIGGALVAAGEEWARSKGCQEMASDAEIENQLSHVAHGRLGYEEVERLVHFRKAL